MTTTPETPALPGDLTDYQHELVFNALDRLANQAILSAGATVLVPKGSDHIKAVRDAATGDAELVRTALAAARVAPVTPSEAVATREEGQWAELRTLRAELEAAQSAANEPARELTNAEILERTAEQKHGAAGAPAQDSGRCGGCRDLGPHRNVPGCDYYKPAPAPVTPSPEERIEAATWALIEGDTDTSDRGVSDEHYRERRAEVERIAPILAPVTPSEPTYSPETRQWTGTCPCLLAEQVDPECEWHGRPEFRRGGAPHSETPSPDREKPTREQRGTLAKVIEGALAQCGISVTYAISGPGELFDVAGLVFERYPALAVPPVVNAPALARVIRSSAARWVPEYDAEYSYEREARELTSNILERQNEWFGTGR
ncbi:hypothetical protein XM48_10640 [Leucobacter sp. Ag1]|uniref:hypothetical protein n=1 Tax=Leucobacter sp. Ag1 TaxID=1642040 RepID=UPI00062195D4|nr:hypothetical protein [Leucobacter sp. Ag1]KKI18729.1 hypothetical protein XM48_10640 [Leucobacter sp. Ag1]